MAPPDAAPPRLQGAARRARRRAAPSRGPGERRAGGETLGAQNSVLQVSFLLCTFHANLAHSLTAPPNIFDDVPVLKTPYYSAMLADLAVEYPNARVVMTHRRPVQAMASLNALQVSFLICTVTFYANLAHSLTRSP
jgi:hypothetical protein